MSSPRIVFGRVASATTRAVPAADATVSRAHVALTDLGGGYVRIEDLQSGNGTFVETAAGWERIDKVRTAIDAKIRLGNALCVTARELLASADGAPRPAENKARTISRYVRSDGGGIERKR